MSYGTLAWAKPWRVGPRSYWACTHFRISGHAHPANAGIWVLWKTLNYRFFLWRFYIIYFSWSKVLLIRILFNAVDCHPPICSCCSGFLQEHDRKYQRYSIHQSHWGSWKQVYERECCSQVHWRFAWHRQRSDLECHHSTAWSDRLFFCSLQFARSLSQLVKHREI